MGFRVTNAIAAPTILLCMEPKQTRLEQIDIGTPAGVFFSGVYSWLVKVLGQFSIIYFRGFGLRIGVRVWVRVRVGVRVWVRVRVRVRVRVSVVLWSG